jgi:hypothetical protein
LLRAASGDIIPGGSNPYARDYLPDYFAHQRRLLLVDCRFDDSVLLLEQLQAWFAEHLPRVTTRLVQLSSVYQRDDPRTWEEIRANGHAAIAGVGH